MSYRTPSTWMVLVGCIVAGFVLGRISALDPSAVPAIAAAQRPHAAGEDGAQMFLPLLSAAADASPQPDLAMTVEALVEENAQQGAAIANGSAFLSYLGTQVPAQNRVPTIDVLVAQHGQLATSVAEIYGALGSPIPTVPPSPTFGPSPTPTRTPFGPSPTPLTQMPIPTP